MNVGYKVYFIRLINYVPLEVYIGLLLFFCIGLVILLAWKGIKAWRMILQLLFAEYVILLLCSTVIFRIVHQGREFDYTPFWSYSKQELWNENIMNVAVFVPIGVLLFFILKTQMSQAKVFLMVFFVGLGLSVLIETLQLIFMKGFSEIDDVIHNTLGCLLGYSFCLIIKKVCRYSMNYCR